MPWTPKQKRYLLSKGSPLKPAQKQKMVGELHANPAMGNLPAVGKIRTGSSPLKALMKVK